MSQTCTISTEAIKVGLTSLGGTLTSVADAEGTEYLWQGDATYWGGQAPILFPICGSIRDDRARTQDGSESGSSSARTRPARPSSSEATRRLSPAIPTPSRCAAATR